MQNFRHLKNTELVKTRRYNQYTVGVLMKTCIYCRASADGPFPKEHVVPQAFGHFKNNLTLSAVCGECNAFFNQELEQFLTRDSVEALQRVRYGLKPKSGRRKLGKSRLIIRVISPGDWYGARLVAERNDAGTEVRCEPLPQVGFRKLGETQRHWFLEDELETTKKWERFRTETQTHIVGKPEAVVQRLANRLLELGIVFKSRGHFEKHGHLVQVYADSILDDIIFRGVAKIALNFLTHARGDEFALRPEFDEIRDYVRFGVMPRHPAVIATNVPVLNGECALQRRTEGHVIVLDWDMMNEGIVCMLSLFNHLTYHIILCRNYRGPWHPLGHGRHFDLETLTISNVGGVSTT
jgi:hypothetical protein